MIDDILNLTHEELAEASGEPNGTLGITTLEHLQKLMKCQIKMSAKDFGCTNCNISGNARVCYLIQSRTMTLCVLEEMVDLMRKDNDNKVGTKQACWRKRGCPFNSNTSSRYLKCEQECYSVNKCAKENEDYWNEIDRKWDIEK